MKYRLTDETYECFKRKLYRIEAIKDFGDVKKGDKGGFIESNKNLAQKGNCWVYGDAKVFDDAKVSGNARVYDEACVFCKAMVYGDAIVRDEATVCDQARVVNALVEGKALVDENAWVYGGAKVCGEARVSGNAQVGDKALVCDHALVFENAVIEDDKIDGITKVGTNGVIANNDPERVENELMQTEKFEQLLEDLETKLKKHFDKSLRALTCEINHLKQLIEEAEQHTKSKVEKR